MPFALKFSHALYCNATIKFNTDYKGTNLPVLFTT